MEVDNLGVDKMGVDKMESRQSGMTPYIPPGGITQPFFSRALTSFHACVILFFVWVEALSPCQQFFSHVGTFSWVESVLSNEDEVSCSRTPHRPW